MRRYGGLWRRKSLPHCGRLFFDDGKRPRAKNQCCGAALFCFARYCNTKIPDDRNSPLCWTLEHWLLLAVDGSRGLGFHFDEMKQMSVNNKKKLRLFIFILFWLGLREMHKMSIVMLWRADLLKDLNGGPF